jgi:hypothetical protein
MDPRWKHPFTCVVAGPTGCGKTTFVLDLVKRPSLMITPPPARVIWVYDDYQEGFKELAGRVTFTRNLEDIEDLPKEVPHLVVIDDQMTEAGGNKILGLFTKGSHHKNLSIIYIVQNLFDKAKQHRTISLNTHYLIVFKNPRDNSQIEHLARQVFPGHSHLVLKAFRDATSHPFGYLLFDFRQDTHDNIRMRTNELPAEQPHYVYRIMSREEEKVMEV